MVTRPASLRVARWADRLGPERSKWPPISPTVSSSVHVSHRISRRTGDATASNRTWASPPTRSALHLLRLRSTLTGAELGGCAVGKYVLVYQGGAMADTEEAQQAAMARWGGWFGSLGSAVVDGGAPFGPSAAVGGGAARSGLTGYSILQAGDLDA